MSADVLLIERAHHYCKITSFRENIATMFQKKSEQLLTCKYLEIDRKLHTMEAHKKMMKFCKTVQSYNCNCDSDRMVFHVEESKEKPLHEDIPWLYKPQFITNIFI